MGSTFSSDAVKTPPPTAKIVSLNGSLEEFSVPVEASKVLLEGKDVLCSSDKLYYDEKATAMGPNEFLQLGQIYFLLPPEYRTRVLKATDMVALAMKASSALAGAATKKNRWGQREARIVPMVVAASESFNEVDFQVVSMESRRRRRQGKGPKYMVNLNTIYEGCVDN
ncbi:hypothetical protein QJS04_geneDACA001432 [Acorus gramineus]|uniref:Uncharacterized protein n=1 Tax=Acorus gramineus TaxID=55184 RepID=A0AAV9A7E2_ACOGR|nr:hypothetical protein QJS04_geneDACA001432 [Acorus gramineus]